MKRRNTLPMLLAAIGLMAIFTTNSSAFTTGDVDDDGAVRLSDALLVLRSVAGTQILTPFQQSACDVIGSIFPHVPDGVCGIDDAYKILLKAYGLTTF